MALGTRKSYKGGAQATTIQGTINAAALSFTVTTGHGTRFPDGSDGQFVMQIDSESILCDSRSGDVFTVSASGRGHDNTTAASHSPGTENVRHILDAESLNDLMDHVYDTGRDDHTHYASNTDLTTVSDALAAHLADAADAHDASAISFVPAGSVAASTVQAALEEVDTEKVAKSTFPVVLIVALSDESTAITTGTAKVTMRMPFAMTLTAVRASLATASSSGIPTVDINEGGASILSTKLTIDASEKTSTTAAAAAVISDAALADDAEITFDIDVAGTGAKGLKVALIGTRVIA